jgi:phosphoserine aminotransferase
VGKARHQTPSIWDYQAMAEADSMVNTPPTFSVYLLGLILAWVADHGGLAGMGERNAQKATALYQAIDGSDFYANPVAKDARSWMNVPFIMQSADLDSDFLAGAEAAGLMNLKGHRSVGGMRASLYNAMPLVGVTTLIEYMKEFERTHG